MWRVELCYYYTHLTIYLIYEMKFTVLTLRYHVKYIYRHEKISLTHIAIIL